MAARIPHSAIVHAQLSDYAEDLQSHISGESVRLATEPSYAGVFRCCLAMHSVLSRLSRNRRVTLLHSAAAVVQRCPLLITTGQLQLAYVDLRRLLECIVRYVYFCEHPIEWAVYLNDPGQGFVRDDNEPIRWCANREQAWYVDYARERFSSDKTGLVAAAVNDIATMYRETSKAVHATLDSTGKAFKHAIEPTSVQDLQAFQKHQRRAYSATAVLSLGPPPGRLGVLTAMERAWFDWLIGSDAAKVIRGGEFLSS